MLVAGDIYIKSYWHFRNSHRRELLQENTELKLVKRQTFKKADISSVLLQLHISAAGDSLLDIYHAPEELLYMLATALVSFLLCLKGNVYTTSSYLIHNMYLESKKMFLNWTIVFFCLFEISSHTRKEKKVQASLAISLIVASNCT